MKCEHFLGGGHVGSGKKNGTKRQEIRLRGRIHCASPPISMAAKTPDAAMLCSSFPLLFFSKKNLLVLLLFYPVFLSSVRPPQQNNVKVEDGGIWERHFQFGNSLSSHFNSGHPFNTPTFRISSCKWRRHLGRLKKGSLVLSYCFLLCGVL